MAKKQQPAKPAISADRELECLIRARYALIYVVSWEEKRVITALQQICDSDAVNMVGVQIWDSCRGLRACGGEGEDLPVDGGEGMKDPDAILDHILRVAGNNKAVAQAKESRGPIFVLCDMFRYLIPGQAWTPELERKLRTISYALHNSSVCVILISPELHLPVSLEKCVTVIDYPLPNMEYLKSYVLEPAVKSLSKKQGADGKNLFADDVPHESVVKSLLGLTVAEAEDAIAKAAIVNGRLDIKTLLELKRQIVRKGQLLDYVYSEDGLEGVGGLDGVKQFLHLRGMGFNEKAREYGIPVPKGLLLIGIQGTGKSLCAKAIANEFQMPLLKLEMGRMFGQWIGQSENQMKRALQQAEAIAPCVLYIDEIDKALSGATGMQTDSGTTKRVIGQLLDWMQEKTAPVFIVAAANSMQGLPAELFRKGRFDELFFVDLPTGAERATIFEIHIKKCRRDPAKFEVKKLVAATEGFSGAEIKSVIDEAMYIGFNDAGREFSTEDIICAIRHCIPLSKTCKEEIDALRESARNCMRKASDVINYEAETSKDGPSSRFDLGEPMTKP